jgi:hypothetical protein
MDEEAAGLGQAEGDRELGETHRLLLGPVSPRPPATQAEVDEAGSLPEAQEEAGETGTA